MEMWDLYTFDRKKTGLTLERGQSVPQGLYHLSVSVWIVDAQGRVLLSQRHPAKTYPLCWECTGGCAQAGETSLDAAVREVKEELGLTLDPRKGRCIRQKRREQTRDFYDVWLFHCSVPVQSLTLQAAEVIDVQWVDLPGLRALQREGRLHPLLDYLDEIFPL